MNKRYIGCFVAVLSAIAIVGPSTASAATEFGDNCTGNEVTEGEPLTLFALTATGSPLPLTAPSAGVITKWKSNLIPVPVTVPQTLKVLRQTGPNTVQVIGESSGNIAGGANTFDARIPVQAGDRLGLFGSSPFGVLLCEGPPNNRLGGFLGGGSVGSNSTFVELEAEARIPASAILEPDADNDGFGDATQDKCPQNAAVQTPCPVVALSVSATARKNLANVLVTSSSQATVKVAGTVNLGKGRKAKISGGTQIVTPGAIAKFTLLFPQKLKAKLKELSRKQFLWLRLNASAPNVVGPATVRKLKVKLKGQAKPKVKVKKPGRSAKS